MLSYLFQLICIISGKGRKSLHAKRIIGNVFQLVLRYFQTVFFSISWKLSFLKSNSKEMGSVEEGGEKKKTKLW